MSWLRSKWLVAAAALLLTALVTDRARSMPVGEICLSRAEVGRLRLAILEGKKRIAELRLELAHQKKQLTLEGAARLSRCESMRKACREAIRRSPPCPRNNCLLPWMVTGISLGVCAVGITAMGVTR